MRNIYESPESTLDTESDLPIHNGAALYKISGIGVATFFGTLLAGGYVASRNLKNLGRPREANRVLVLSALATVTLFFLAYLIPDDVNIPNSVFTVVQVIVMIQLSKKWFEEDIEVHTRNGGKLASNWLAFGISLLIMAAIAAVIYGLIFLALSQ